MSCHNTSDCGSGETCCDLGKNSVGTCNKSCIGKSCTKWTWHGRYCAQGEQCCRYSERCGINCIGEPCTSNNHCATGETCCSGVCRTSCLHGLISCNNNKECPPGKYCSGIKVCNKTRIAQACNTDSDCSTGQCCGDDSTCTTEACDTKTGNVIAWVLPVCSGTFAVVLFVGLWLSESWKKREASSELREWELRELA